MHYTMCKWRKNCKFVAEYCAKIQQNEVKDIE